jgi:prophage DNA circulation protein
MTAVTDLGAALLGLVASAREVALSPQDQIQILTPLAGFADQGSWGDDVTGRAQQSAQAAQAAFCRRAALAAMGRAVGACAPASYDEAVALRDQVCGLIESEITVAGDTGDDAACTALRALKTAVASDLTRKGADLARLQQVSVGAALPALVHAYRLYQDAGRADEVADYADADDPTFMPSRFQALGR